MLLFLRKWKPARAKKLKTSHVRSFVLTRTWSRLYRQPGFFVDLSYAGNRYGAVIQGKLLIQSYDFGKTYSLILMHTTQELIMSELKFKVDGPFRFAMHEPGDYQLIVDTGEEVIEMDTFKVG
ncbi:MAG: hypothetical protein KC422_08085 [Trueperaceae bacterium]|nr:hypothetical protein [Trueperaceae bacterium]